MVHFGVVVTTSCGLQLRLVCHTARLLCILVHFRPVNLERSKLVSSFCQRLFRQVRITKQHREMVIKKLKQQLFAVGSTVRPERVLVALCSLEPVSLHGAELARLHLHADELDGCGCTTN